MIVPLRFLTAALIIGSALFCASLRAQNAPQAFEAIAFSPTEIRLYWLPLPGAAGYRLHRFVSPPGQPPLSETIFTLTAKEPRFTDSGLASGTQYRYEIRGLDADGKPVGETRTYVERTLSPLPARSAEFDVVIAQASSGGVASAIEAGRRGLKVALIEPTLRLGGMPVNGLCASDLRRNENESGFFVRFRKRVSELYAAEGIKADGRKYEPRIAHQAMKSLLYEMPNVTVFRRTRLRWGKVNTRAVLDDPDRRRVESVEVEELDSEGEPTRRRTVLKAKFFIDATDCGDLAAWAGAAFRIGREPRTPEEPHNGVIYYDRQNKAALPGSTGKGDHRLQSYAYLLVVKDYGDGADKSIPVPPGYRKEDYAEPQLPTWKSTWAFTDGSLPNAKYELNQHPKGGDLQEVNYRYAAGGYRERRRVERLYRQRVLGYLAYLQKGYGKKSLGLPDDEFRENGGMPPLLYVREGRRILGEQLPTEADITRSSETVRPNSIGLGDYPMDSHAVRKKTDTDPRHRGEGEWWLYEITPPHSLPFGVMVPRTLDNVLVTTAVSSTHVSYGTYRMEPVRMAFGQAAGIAAFLGIRYHLAGREIPAREVQDELLPRFSNPLGDPAVLLRKFTDLNPSVRYASFLQWMAVRGFLPDGGHFAPDAPTTSREFVRWLDLLARRSGLPFPTFRPNPPAADPQTPISRADFARGLAAILAHRPLPASFSPNIYSDVPETLRASVELLNGYNITSPLWEGAVRDPQTRQWQFRPEAPISHAAALFSLYLAQIGAGPLFLDHPLDRFTQFPLPKTP